MNHRPNTERETKVISDVKTVVSITPEWLTSVLRSAGKIKNSKVVSLARHHLSACAEGFLSIVTRLDLEYDFIENGAPRSLVTKEQTEKAALKEFGHHFRTFEHEIRFYREIAPLSDLRLAECYYSWLDTSSGDGFLLFEDLSDTTAGDDLAGITYEQCMNTVTAIGRLHGDWWKADKLAQLTWLKEHEYMYAGRFGRFWQPFLKKSAQRLTQKQIALGDELSTKMLRVIEYATTRPVSITHCDLRADNIRYDLSHSCIPIILDWQLLTKGLSAFDVVRLTCGSLDLSMEQHKDLWTSWREVLCSRGVREYSLADAEHDYHIALLIALHIPPVNSYYIDVEGTRGADLVLNMIDRYFRAAEVLDIHATLKEI